MSTEIKNGHCLELRTAEPADLPAVLTLLDQAHLPTAGVAEKFSQFIVAESEGQLVGVVGLELYAGSALLRSAAVEERWRGHYFPRFGFTCVSRESVAKSVQSSIEFQEACPASAVVMRKSLSGSST